VNAIRVVLVLRRLWLMALFINYLNSVKFTKILMVIEKNIIRCQLERI
jgi:hypothetical protein